MIGWLTLMINPWWLTIDNRIITQLVVNHLFRIIYPLMINPCLEKMILPIAIFLDVFGRFACLFHWPSINSHHTWPLVVVEVQHVANGAIGDGRGEDRNVVEVGPVANRCGVVDFLVTSQPSKKTFKKSRKHIKKMVDELWSSLYWDFDESCTSFCRILVIRLIFSGGSKKILSAKTIQNMSELDSV